MVDKIIEVEGKILKECRSSGINLIHLIQTEGEYLRQVTIKVIKNEITLTMAAHKIIHTSKNDHAYIGINSKELCKKGEAYACTSNI